MPIRKKSRPRSPRTKSNSPDARADCLLATQRGWTLISHNKRHFQRWHRVFQQQGRTHSGIILLPKSPLPRLELRAAMTLDWIDQQAHPIGSSLLLWNDVQQWLNQGRMLRGYSRQEIQEATGQAP